MQKAFSIREALSFGWKQTMKHLVVLAGSILVVGIVIAVLNMSNASLSRAHHDVASFLISILVAFLKLASAIGFVRFGLAYTQNKEISVKQAFYPTKQLLPYIGGYILYGIVIFVGTLLLLVPGIIFAIWYSFSTYGIVDKNLSIISAFKESKKITKGHFWKLLGLSFVLVIINILCALTLVGLLVSVPLSIMVMAHVYIKLRDASAHTGENKSSHEPEKKESTPVVLENTVA